MKKIKAEHGPESVAAVQPRHRPALLPARAEELGRDQLRRAVVRAVPRPARRRLRADLRRRPGLARADRHREHRLPGADRLAPGREHAQLAGAGVRAGGRAAHPDHRRRPALLGRREQGEVLAADQARHRPRAAARLDATCWSPKAATTRRSSRSTATASTSSPPRSRATRPNGRPTETGIDADLIRATAREFASHRPATHRPPRAGASTGTATTRSAAAPSRCCQRAARQLGPQGRALPVAPGMKIAPYPLPKYPKSDKPQGRRLRRRARTRSPTKASPPASATRRSPASRIRSRAGSSIRRTSCTRCRTRRETLKAIDKLDLLVVVDTLPSEIAGYADVVLPEATFLERHDELLVGFGRTGWTSLRQPVVAAPHEQKPGWWIAKQLAEQARHRRLHAVQGHGGVPGLPHREVRLQLGRTSRRDGVIMGEHAADHRRGRARARRSTRRRRRSSSGPTSSRRRASTRCRSTRRPPAAPGGHFRLITGRAPVHTFSRTQTNPLLHDLMPENEVWVNARDRGQAGAEEPATT